MHVIESTVWREYPFSCLEVEGLEVEGLEVEGPRRKLATVDTIAGDNSSNWNCIWQISDDEAQLQIVLFMTAFH